RGGCRSRRAGRATAATAPPPRAPRYRSPVPAATAPPPAPVGWDRTAKRRSQPRARKESRRWFSFAGCPRRPILERARVRAAIDQEVLAGDVARLRAAEIGAGVAEFGGIAEPPGRDGAQPIRRHLLLRQPGRLGKTGDRLSGSVGEERARQQVVDGHVVLRGLPGEAGDEAG